MLVGRWREHEWPQNAATPAQHREERPVPAYIIVETDVHDHAQFECYKEASLVAVKAHGGRFVVAGGELTVLEGEWRPKRLVMLEFDSLEAAKQFYASDVYQEAKRLREGAANLHMVAVEGLAEPAETR